MKRRTVLLGAIAAGIAAPGWPPAPVAASATKTRGHAAAGPIVIQDAWARASAGIAGTGAVYLTIRNTGTHPDRLIAASAPIARRAELHTHIMKNHVMRMRRIDTVALPPGTTIGFQPGGRHVMLMGLRAPLREGAQFPLTLAFEKAGTLSVDVVVRGIAARGHGAMGHGARK